MEELGVRDVTWVNPAGVQMTEEHWRDPVTRCVGMLLDGRAQTTGIRQRGKEATLLILINGNHEGVDFTLPECPGATRWDLLIDTNMPEERDTTSFEIGSTYTVPARSLLLFALAAEPVALESE